MTKTNTLLKGLLGATALTVFTTGSAHAQLTPAGTTVGNTFTLDYQVGGVDQPTIDTGPTGTDTPTEFTVDRLIDLTVASQGNNTVAPGALNQDLVFSVTNDGNDTQAYALTVIDETGTPGDTIDTIDPADASPPLVYFIDDGDGIFEPGTGAGNDGAPIVYDPANPPELGPDEVLFVVVEQDIPTTATDGDEADVSLVADTLEPLGTPNAGDPVTGDGDGNAILGAAENVLADGSGTGNEGNNAGDHSATGTYIVASADVNAVKTVVVFDETGAGCNVTTGTPVAGDYGIPGACMEYRITVTNSGSQPATAIQVTDDLPDELLFGAASFVGFTGGSFSSPSLPSNGDDCATDPCVVNLEGATLAGTADPAVPTIGTVIIRATVK